jgi:hypothetical protein
MEPDDRRLQRLRELPDFSRCRALSAGGLRIGLSRGMQRDSEEENAADECSRFVQV